MKKPATPISLVGLPGSGKSTVGKLLARRLDCSFLDTDALIEKRLQCSVRVFFEREGEARFRDIEAQVLDEVLQPQAAVVSTGGGAVIRPGNRTALHERSACIYLRSTPDELFRRLRHDTQRPLLQVKDPLAKLRELYTQRDPMYRKAAHFVIETGRPSVNTLVNMILMQLELAGLVPGDAVPSPVDSRASGPQGALPPIPSAA